MIKGLLHEIINKLQRKYGRPSPPKWTDPLSIILLENVAYLVSDAQRQKAFEALCNDIGLSPHQILSAPEDRLHEVAKLGGMHPAQRVDKLRLIAQIALRDFKGDLGNVLKLPLAQAKKALRKFPGIGDPGAEKILLFSRVLPVLALESNGLRVLLRIGVGREQKSYAVGYRSAQEAVKAELPSDCRWLVRAHQLLRQHGQETCRRAQPICEICPLTNLCKFYQRQVGIRSTN